MAFRASEFRLVLIAQNRASNTLRSVSRDLRALETQGKTFGSRFSYASTVVGDLGRTMALFGGISVGALAVAANSAAKFNSQVALISTQTDNMAKTSRLAYREILRDMTIFPASADQMTASLYDIYSGTQLVGKGGTRALKVFNKAAVAGQVDLNTATQAGITVLNNYGHSAKDLPKLLNQMFSAVRFGRMTFEQFSGSLNQIVPAFATTHQSILDMLGSMAFLTRQMPSTSMAATSLSRAIETLAKPQMTKGLEKVGVHIRDMHGNLKPLKDIIGLILQRFPKLATGEMNVETFLKNMTNQQGYIQARRGLTQLFQHYKDFLKVDAQVRGDTNEFTRSYARLAQTAGVQWGIFVNQLHAAAIILGSAVLPVFLEVVKPVRELIRGFMDLDAGTKATVGRLIALGAIGTTIAGVFLSLTAGITGFIALMLASGTALSAFLAVAGGLAGFAGLALLVYKNWGSIKSFLVRYWPDIMHAAMIARDNIKRAIEDITALLGHMVGMIGELIRGDWSALWKDFSSAVGNAFDLFKMAAAGSRALISGWFDLLTSSVQGATAAVIILLATLKKLAVFNSASALGASLFGGTGLIRQNGKVIGKQTIPGFIPTQMRAQQARMAAAQEAKFSGMFMGSMASGPIRSKEFGTFVSREGAMAVASLSRMEKAAVTAKAALAGIGTGLAGLVGLTGPQGLLVAAGVGIGLMVYAITRADSGFNRLADDAKAAASAIREMDDSVSKLTGSLNNLPTNVGARIVALGDLHNVNAQIGQARHALSLAAPGRPHQQAEDALNSLLQQRADILGQIKGLSGNIAKNFADFGKGINEFTKRTTKLSDLRQQLSDYRSELEKLNHTTPANTVEAGRQRAKMEELRNAIAQLRKEIKPLNSEAQKLGAGLRKNVGQTLRDLGTRGVIPKLNQHQFQSAIQAVIQHPPRNLRELKLEIRAVMNPRKAERDAAALKNKLQRDFPGGKPVIKPGVDHKKALGSAHQLMRKLVGIAVDSSPVGLAISQGIASGINAGKSSVVSAMVSAVYDALNAGRTAAGIKSPSTVAAEKIGKPFIQGVAMGMLKEAGGVKAAMKTIVQTMVDTWNQLHDQLQGSFGTPFGGPRGDLISTIMGFGGRPSMKLLTGDLRGQVHKFSQWMHALDSLRGRIPGSLYLQLLELGPDSLGAVQTLAHASKHDLKEYKRLFNREQRLITSGTQRAFLAQTGVWKHMGKNMAFGLLTGLQAEKPYLIKFFKQIAREMFHVRHGHHGGGGGGHAQVHYHYHAAAHGGTVTAQDRRSRFEFERHIRKLPRP